MILAAAFILTPVVYALARALAVRFPSPWTNPVGVSVLALIVIVRFSELELGDYQEASSPWLWLLRPAVVALGWLMYQQRDRLAELVWPLVAGVVVGTVVSMLVTPLIARALGAGEALQRALALKSVTSAVGVDLAGRVGAEPGLTVPLIILAGILGAAFGAPLLRAAGMRDRAVMGVAVGTNSHGIGTAGVSKEGPLATAASGLAMGASALATALFAPVAWWLLGWPPFG